MLNDYKPTHDPNVDTFKVQYLLGGSAVLAIVFPQRYEITEVSGCTLIQSVSTIPLLTKKFYATDSMGLLDMARIRRHSPSALHAPTNRRSRNNHHPLLIRARHIQGALHTQLAISVLRRGICGSDPMDRRSDSDSTLCRFFLDLLYQVRLGSCI